MFFFSVIYLVRNLYCWWWWWWRCCCCWWRWWFWLLKFTVFSFGEIDFHVKITLKSIFCFFFFIYSHHVAGCFGCRTPKVCHVVSSK
ncbi:hypothetical protein TCDM_03860 [Trypanosoma cruzi Dm28c]|uniref:Uncharacterized protein n=1 Tax=Trypanosoma cruzi Dm28c TaxID=1416333 RepID=V5BS75_TRYCR|nr:hypothetical protein TCDM_03860 [Trypanosoma cruzi Dm28c]